MKTASLIAALSLVVSVSAAAFQENRNGFQRFGQHGNGGRQGNNNGRQGNQQNSNNGNDRLQNTNTGSTTSAAASTSTAAASASTSNSTSTGSASNATSTAASASGSGGNEQTSLTLDPAVIASGFAQNGQENATVGQVASLTSTNNFINFCLTGLPNVPLTNGQQITSGSCNPAPMGLIPSNDNMPSAKFAFPPNGGQVVENTAFTITMNINNLASGNFVNAELNYFAAPQQLNSAGQILGHSHVVVETLTSATQTTPTNPKNFAFFKGLNAAAVNGQLTADVSAGLPAGSYKLSSINTAANHQPVLVPVAQHGSLDDAIYFTVVPSGAAASSSASNAGGNSTVSAAAVASTSASAAAVSASASASASQAGGKSVASAAPVATSQNKKQGKRFHSRALN
jgi:hypothetical protein